MSSITNNTFLESFSDQNTPKVKKVITSEINDSVKSSNSDFSKVSLQTNSEGEKIIISKDIGDQRNLIAGINTLQSLSVYPDKNPITITSNSQFSTNGFTGSGTQIDPYILTHYNFYYNTISTTAIKVSNTDAYFEVYQNTFSTNVRSSSFSPFIVLTNVSHATVQNNTFQFGYTAIQITGAHSDSNLVKDNKFSIVGGGVYITATSEPITIRNNTFNDVTKNGIDIKSSQNISIVQSSINKMSVGISITGTNTSAIFISNNTITNGQDAIGAFSISGNVSIINNTISTHTSAGITLSSTKNNNRVENNTITNTGDSGIDITSSVTGASYGTIVKNNNLTDSYIFVETSSLIANYTQGEFTNNFVNNRPVDFFQYTNNPTFSANPAEIIVLYSTNVTIKNLPVISGPFIVSSSENVYISNITVNNSHFTGIDLFKNKNVTVTNTKLINLWSNGIETDAYNTANAFQLVLTNNYLNSTGNCPQLYCDGLILRKISSNSTIYNNTVENFQYGIHLYYADNTTLLHNNIVNSSNYGMFIDYSNNVNITNNDIDARNSYVLYFIGITSIKSVRDNRFYNNSVDLSNFIGSDFVNNTYENKPISIFLNLQNQVLYPNGTIPSVYGQLYLQNAQFVEIKDLQILYDLHSVTSVNVTVTNITVRDHGILFFDTHNSTFINNQINSTNIDGLRIQSDTNFFDNFVIKNNRIIGKNFGSTTGIYLSGINNFIIENNSVKYFQYGVFLNGDANGVVKNNYITGTDGPSYASGSGVYVSYAVSENNYIASNIIKYYSAGIFINYNVIYVNTFYNNTIQYGGYGINLSQSINSTIDSNRISFSSTGIYFNKANFNRIKNNIISNSTNYNLYLTQSTFNTFTNNLITNTTYHDVDLLSSSVNNTFIGNNFTNNYRYIIFDTTSGNNTLKNNVFVNTLYVAIQISSSNNLITNNDFIGNNWTNTNFPPGKQIQITNVNNIVVGNYYSDHSNLDFNWDDRADSPYTNFGTSLIDPSPNVRPNNVPDIVAPLMFLLTGNNTYYNVNGFVFSYKISEKSLIQIYINGVSNNTLANNSLINWLPDGTYNITLVVIDLAGNYNLAYFFVTIDTFAPVISFVSLSNTTYDSLAINVTYSITDKLNYTTLIYINGLSNDTVSNNTFWTLQEGYNNITIYAVDLVGNYNVLSVYFTIDTQPPNLTVKNPTNTTYYTSPIQFDYVITDLSNYNLTIYINDQANTSAINPNTYVSFSNGFYNITFVVTDSLNHRTTYTQFFTVDLLPELSVYTLDNTSYNTNEIIVNYTYYHAIQVQFYFDGIQNSTDINNGTLKSFLDGYHNITIIGFDSFNRNTFITYIFLIDTITPVVTIISPSHLIYNTNTLTITYHIDENNSYSTLILLDGQSFAVTNGSNYQFADGEYNLTVIVTDEVGNTALTTVLFTVNTNTSTTTKASSTTSNPTTKPSSNTSDSNSKSSSKTSSQTSPFSITGMLLAILLISIVKVLFINRKRKI